LALAISIHVILFVKRGNVATNLLLFLFLFTVVCNKFRNFVRLWCHIHEHGGKTGEFFRRLGLWVFEDHAFTAFEETFQQKSARGSSVLRRKDRGPSLLLFLNALHGTAQK
jgi:hypothetical protein